MEVRGFAILHCSQLTGTLTLPSPLFKREAERSRLLRIVKVTDPLGHDVATAVSADADVFRDQTVGVPNTSFARRCSTFRPL
jgi:hypothetical protein